ncbi:hypothetical protein ACFORG_19305 [Lutimaribacter marinistellae]|uniref:Type IV pilus biogenesis protein PilP n=1 Tax=Lutimaribacter marinistellae TaxID=1820329 RepID=A0ABV7TLS4_9RHOB
MKPAFALSLSFEGISLLHRAAGGWRRVGDVALDTADLAGALSGLREKALRLEPQVTSKLVIPNEQIKYLTVETGSLDDPARIAAVEAALEGATPYALADLAYDMSPEGDVTHVAAVARETLDEAEAFAREHGFDPLSYVAIPGENPFLGEPFFGPAHDVAELTGSAAVDPDGIAIVVIGEAEIPPTETPAEEAPAPPTVDPFAKAEAVADPEPEAAPEPAEKAIAPVIGFTSRRGKTEDDTPAAPVHAPATRSDLPDTAPTEKPKSEPEPPTESKPVETPPSPAKPVAAPVLAPELDLPDLPQTAAPQAHAVAGPVPASTGFAAAQAPADEAERLTIFGARESNRATRGKPRYLGLALSVALLIFLAGVALWAALFLDDGVTGLFRSEPETTEVAQTQISEDPQEPAPESAPQATSTEAEAPVEPAAAAPEVLASLPQDETLSETDGAVLDALRQAPRVVAPLADELADTEPEETAPAQQALYAATGIWPNAPEVPELPGLISLDDVYIASIDRRDLSQDAVALAPAQAFDTDVQMTSLVTPSAAGASFELDARGLVTPTPEGTLNPDGILVHAGPPPLVPPATPVRFEEEPEIDAARERLAGFRPRVRPDALVEQNERFQLGGRTREELAGVRPKLRPESLQQQVQEATPSAATPTENAIAASTVPKLRPKDLEKQAEQDDDEPQRVPARTVKPSSPSPKTVSRQATVNNAINLRKVNLIGVYGTPANRRALVRLPSGRYKKVKVGDRVDGGRVLAIGDSELRYQKGGRNLTLKIPSG